MPNWCNPLRLLYYKVSEPATGQR